MEVMTYTAKQAIATVLNQEGGFAVDHAGPTNYGITLRALKASGDLGFDIDRDGDLDEIDLRGMTRAQAGEYYFEHWWCALPCKDVPYQSIAAKCFDFSVNMGHRRAARLLQWAVNEHLVGGEPLVLDGVIGPKTIAGIASLPEWRIMKTYRDMAANFYRTLVDGNPAKFAQYKNGWLARAYS